MHLKLGFYVDYIQWKAYHTHLTFPPYGDHSLNTHKTFFYELVTIGAIHEFIASYAQQFFLWQNFQFVQLQILTNNIYKQV
jgi:hypothetical protein